MSCLAVPQAREATCGLLYLTHFYDKAQGLVIMLPPLDINIHSQSITV